LMALFGVGLGFANTALLIAVQSSVPWQRRGVATASTMLFRTLGGALAVGGLGELLGAKLRDRPELAADAARLLAEPGGAHFDATRTAELASVLGGALGTIFWVIAALSTLSFAVGWLFPAVEFERA